MEVGAREAAAPDLGRDYPGAWQKSHIPFLCQKNPLNNGAQKYQQPAWEASDLLTFEKALKYQRANGVEEPFLKGE